MQIPYSTSAAGSELVLAEQSTAIIMVVSGAGKPGGYDNGTSANGTGSGVTPLKGLIAGGMSGAVETTFSYPTNYVKTQLQLDERGEYLETNGTQSIS